MKNLKKLVALTLTVAMLLSSFTVAFAANSADATTAEALGVIKGSGDEGVTAEYLATTPTRAQAALMSLRLKGLEAEALAYTGTEKFDDQADAEAFWQPILSYLKANPELGWVGTKVTVEEVEQTNFNPNALMSAQAYVKVMLEALGYKQGTDFEWAEVFTFAATVGLTEPTGTFDVDALCAATVEALKATTADGAELYKSLFTDAEVVAAGLIVAPTDMAVVSVTALNLIQLEVVFNQKVDETSAEKVANYEISDLATGAVAADDAELQEDGMTVVLTLDTAAAQQELVDVTIEDVENLDEVALDETEVEDVQFLDMVIPSVVSADVVGKDTIKVVFSEPVESNHASIATQLLKSGFEVNDGKLYIEKVTLQNNNTEALVVLYSDLKAGEVTIEVNSTTEDYAGFGVVKTAFALTVVTDEDAPVVVGYEKATPNGVTLIFSEDIELVDGTTTNYYHTNSGNPVKDAIDANDINGTKLVLDFSTEPLPNGTAYVYVLKDSIKDLWGNKNAQQMVIVEVEIDETAPAVEGDIKVNAEDKITVYFSEDLDVTSAEKEANYTILDKDGKEVKDAVDTAAYTASTATTDAKVVIDLDEKLGGDYALVIEDVEDLAGNSIADTTIEFTVNDLTDPDPADFTAKIYKAGAAGQMVKISFGEEMASEGKYSVLDLEKYTIDGEFLATLDVEPTITLVDGGKAVEIKVASDETTDGVDLGTTGNIVIARVADAAGNYMVVNQYTFAYVEQGTVGLEAVKAIDTVTMTVEFTDELVEFDADDLVLTTDITNADAAQVLTIIEVETTVNSDGNTVATFTVEDADEFDYDLATPVYAYVAAASPVSHNVYGEALNTTDVLIAADKIAPAIALYDHDTDTDTDKVDEITADQGEVRIQFTEPMNLATMSILSFEVKDATVSGIALANDATYGNDSVVVLTIGATEKPLAETKVTQKSDVKDKNGNVVTALASEVAVFADTVAVTETIPAVTDVDNDADALVVTVSEELYLVADHTVIADGTDLSAAFSSDNAGATVTAIYDKANLTITLSIDVVADGDTITFTFSNYEDSVRNAGTNETWDYDLAGTIWAE